MDTNPADLAGAQALESQAGEADPALAAQASAPESDDIRDDGPREPRTAVLSRLRIAGFKSFAEATTVEVLPGLTGIVGPNGCGKSNVVEALRWAMGESNARHMRGGEMDDVIFAGTSSRAGRNQAEVTLSLEEAAGLAPPPNSEVAELEITRRIERGAGTGYRINGKETRGRDVATLFADIGSGARASGMVSQGRVAALIGAKPEERRSVLEEAAGTAGLRARRHEAELKLRQAETNLTRADDLRAQLEGQQESLKKQARQAARYRNLSGLTRAAEAEWMALLAARAEGQLLSARQALDAARSTTKATEAAAEAATRRAHAADMALPGPRAAEAAARTALERRRVEGEGLAAAEARARATLDAATGRLAQIQADHAHAATVVHDAETAESRLNAEAGELATALAGLPARVEAAAERLAAAEDTAREREAEAERAAEAASEAALAFERFQDARRAAEANLRRVAAEAARLEEERAKAQAANVSPEALSSAAAEAANAEAALAEARAGFENAEAARAAAAAREAEAKRAAAEAEAEEARARDAARVAGERARRAAEGHERLKREHEGAKAACIPADRLDAARKEETEAARAAEAAADALAKAEADRAAASSALSRARTAESEAGATRARAAAEAQGLAALLRAGERGNATPILDSVAVPPGLEAALGAALGEGLDLPADPKAPRHWRALPPLDPVPGLPEGATPLSDLVQAPPELARALSQIGLVEDQAHGLAMQPALAPGQALVARDGGFWRWDGQGANPGAPSPGAERLRQRNRLRAQEKARDEAEAALAKARSEAEAARAAETAASAAENAARNARREAESRLSRARQEASRLSASAAMAESRLSALTPALERAEVERAEAEALLETARAAQQAAPDAAAARAARDAAVAALRGAAGAEEAARNARRQAEGRLDSARSAQSALASRAAAAEGRLAALEPQIARLADQKAEAEAAREAVEREGAGNPDPELARNAALAARNALAEARREEVEARAARQALDAEAERLAARRAALEEEAASWAARRADAAARLIELTARQEAAAIEAAAAADAPEEAAALLANASRMLAEVEAAHTEAAAALHAAETEARESAEARRLADAAFAAAREAQARADGAAARAEDEGRAVATRILEKLGPDTELPEPPEDLSDAAEEKARRKAERLAREREEMGPVNLRAEVEMAEVEERLVNLEKDREEIGHAIAKLRGSIGHLNREGRDRLRAVFERVDAEFRALFSRLFGGGRAHLALVGSDDILEAGLEIYAEPPGKKLSSLSLLSGGEQALTALSLIFAVFKCQPAPVCVLDEVDAPLDDANVERLCTLLEAMTEGGTRFLVVTHHPLTMARMHRLYGVTMQERGVSRLLSVDLGRAVELAESGAA
ncbi:chromosome segregation SMC family protein [Roseomonas populi]|uniref:Chromosome partition protein Smc n=1 Tax=Roseomonas populi TaxID=3121582 RepID=A0ABT1X7C7_9PROT|nr:AAA family ATPase [Roseomonas pecuniae]MCR0983057.1 AAA family ATPase [Roseomonas pecuniae]